MINKNKTSCYNAIGTSICIGCTLFLSGIVNPVLSSQRATGNLSIQVINSFQAETYFSDISNFYISGDTIYTSGTLVDVTFSSEKAATYTSASSDIVGSYIGSGIGMYEQNRSITLTPGDGEKVIPSYYVALDDEYFQAPDLEIVVDTTPPSISLPISPNLGMTTKDTSILFSWAPSEDTHSGVKNYILEIAQEPSFSSPEIYNSIDTSIRINDTLLPTGVLYRRVKAIDFIGNQSIGPSSFFKKNESRTFKGGSTPEKPTFDVDNISLRGYTNTTSYVCDGDIRGYVYSNKDPDDVTLHIQFMGGEKIYSYEPQVNNIGYYAIPIDFVNTQSPMYLPGGTYTVQVEANHPVAGKKIFTYENFIVTDKCEEDKIIQPPMPEHLAAPTYLKNTFDIQRIKRQNIHNRVLQRKPTYNNTLLNKDPLSAALQYPNLLQKTGVDPRMALTHLILLQKFSPDLSSKFYLGRLIHILQPGRYVGMILIMFLCYDIELYNKRLLKFYNINK